MRPGQAVVLVELANWPTSSWPPLSELRAVGRAISEWILADAQTITCLEIEFQRQCGITAPAQRT